MKKQILAVAVAGAFAVPAFAAADTDVTLFGQLQTQIVHHSGGSSDFDNGLRMHDAGGAGWMADGNGPNRLGVMVNHDLGNGMTALAKIEEDIQTNGGDEGGFRSGSRDLYVGLDGNFGRVTIGRQNLPYSTAGKDPLNGTFMQARGNGARLGTGGGIGGLGNGSYQERVIKYANSFGMVGLQVAVAADNGSSTDRGSQAWSGRLNFDLNPVELYVAHTNADDFIGADQDFSATKIGVDWKSGPFRLVAEVEDYTWETATGFTNRDATGGFVSGVYTMGRNDFVLSLGTTRSDADAGDGNTDFAALAVKHNFSNRVMAFAGVSYTSLDDNVPFARPLSGDPAGAGNSYTGVGGGMRVSF
ncbi:porin [Thioalkalivibrio sp. AKL8]|uniref:porin n=1 Tax=Thioalkalivibrio sp. AKL8 TaxID=1158156 RepID=UPI000361B10D|nr:porin [Thioalkalivibrio sp. AKL8]